MTATELPIVLGGHSFIGKLGNDPRPDEDKLDEILNACLDNGIVWIDTTYQPERIRCGDALQRIGRRSEAKVIVWNFFGDFHVDEQIVPGQKSYQADHLPLIQEQARSDYVDCLNIMLTGDERVDAPQLELASNWKSEGFARSIGVWNPPPVAPQWLRDASVEYATEVWRYTTEDPDIPVIFRECKNLGWTTSTTSPFNRGRDLDNFAENGLQKTELTKEALKERISDHLIRYSFSLPCVDRVIIGARSADYIAKNIESYRRGPLSLAELQWLANLRS